MSPHLRNEVHARRCLTLLGGSLLTVRGTVCAASQLLDDQLEKSNDGSFSVEKQSAKYNLCRAVAIIADIKLMEKNNDMRLRAFICYGMNVQSLHRWMQVSTTYVPSLQPLYPLVSHLPCRVAAGCRIRSHIF